MNLNRANAYASRANDGDHMLISRTIFSDFLSLQNIYSCASGGRSTYKRAHWVCALRCLQWNILIKTFSITWKMEMWMKKMRGENEQIIICSVGSLIWISHEKPFSDAFGCHELRWVIYVDVYGMVATRTLYSIHSIDWTHVSPTLQHINSMWRHSQAFQLKLSVARRSFLLKRLMEGLPH